MRNSPVVVPSQKNCFFADFAKIAPQKDRFPAIFSAWNNDRSKERINLPGVTLFDFCRISNRSGGKEGVPPRRFHSRSSVVCRNLQLTCQYTCMWISSQGLCLEIYFTAITTHSPYEQICVELDLLKYVVATYLIMLRSRYIDPQEFRPERWLPPAIDARKGTPRSLTGSGRWF